jgi:predicted NBD/HSP70 family sugar kinase
MAVPNDLRQINRRRVVLAALRLGVASRSQLGKATGLSLPTAGKIVDELVDEAVLTAAPRLERAGRHDSGDGVKLGRPGQSLRLDPDTPRYLAIQLGIFNTRLAALAASPPEVDAWATAFATPDSPRQWATSVATALKRVLPRPRAVIVSAPGVVDETTGTIRICPNLHWADGVNVPTLLRPVIGGGCPVHVVQEIRGLALGALAAMPGTRDFLLVDFGHGIGSTAVIGGKVHRGNVPMIGEIGHTPVPRNDRPCGCGAVGCLETLVSRGALTSAVLGAAAVVRGGRDGVWAKAVAAVAERGINRDLARAIDAAGAGIAAALNALGVDRVIVTGSLTELPEVVMARLAGAVRRNAFWARVADVDIVTGPRRRLAGLGYVVIDRIIAPTV